LEPFTYLLQVPGKNIRKKLLHAFNLWLDVEQKKGELI
jgi:geranylgeranyl diphosphate synthase type 3